MRSWGHTWDRCCLVCHSRTCSQLSQDGLAEVKIAAFCRAGSIFFSSKGGFSRVLGFLRALVLPKKEHCGLAVVLILFSRRGRSLDFYLLHGLVAKEKCYRWLQRHVWVLRKSGMVVTFYPGFGWDTERVYPTAFFISFGSPAWNKMSFPSVSSTIPGSVCIVLWLAN